jgi:hypothetical protein
LCIAGSQQKVAFVHIHAADSWKRAINEFSKTRYSSIGTRATTSKFYCKIKHSENDILYLVEGSFVPNRLNPDSNGNNRLDILRCKMSNTQQAYMEYARSNHDLHMEIYRDHQLLIRYLIPWKTRKTGYMFTPPPNPDAATSISTFDPWTGFNKKNPGVWKNDRVYMAVPGWEDSPSKETLPLLLEFIQHHILLGVDHIFIGVLTDYDSRNMGIMNDILGSYIAEGYVSLSSHTGVDGTYRLVYAYLYACMFVRIYTCTYMHIYIYIYTYIHIFIYMHIQFYYICINTYIYIYRNSLFSFK